MSLFARIAWTGLALLAVAVLLALLVWKPSSQRAFSARTDVLLRSAEREFGAIATSLVDNAMTFSASASLAADEQRAFAIEDLPLDLFRDAEGRLDGERLREAMRVAVTDPEASGARKLGAVRAEILDRTRRDVARRLEGLRETQRREAARHGERAAWRTIAAWAGLLLLLLAGWALALDRVVLRPVRAATDAIGRFGAGERGVRLDPEGARELASLARAFNETARENEELRTRLEEKVRERTAALVRAARVSTAGTMAGGVAHEFNNLLSGILGCADAALAERPSREVEESLSMIRKTAARGVGITRALLRATRAEPELAECELGDLLDEVLGEVRPGAGVEVRKDVAPVRIEADAAMLRQVLDNLVRNALEAIGEAGRLELRVAREGGEAVVEVADTGPGIEPAVQDILFEPFVTTRRGGREGAGLGLFLAESLVTAHGGRIEVETRAGEGTRFRVRLPSARDS